MESCINQNLGFGVKASTSAESLLAGIKGDALGFC